MLHGSIVIPLQDVHAPSWPIYLFILSFPANTHFAVLFLRALAQAGERSKLLRLSEHPGFATTY